MRSGTHKQVDIIEDDFWTAYLPFFTAEFPTYYTKPQKVWGRFHTSEEQYLTSEREIIPLKQKKGKRTYILMQPYVLEPKLTIRPNYNMAVTKCHWKVLFLKSVRSYPKLISHKDCCGYKKAELAPENIPIAFCRATLSLIITFY